MNSRLLLIFGLSFLLLGNALGGMMDFSGSGEDDEDDDELVESTIDQEETKPCQFSPELEAKFQVLYDNVAYLRNKVEEKEKMWKAWKSRNVTDSTANHGGFFGKFRGKKFGRQDVKHGRHHHGRHHHKKHHGNVGNWQKGGRWGKDGGNGGKHGKFGNWQKGGHWGKDGGNGGKHGKFGNWQKSGHWGKDGGKQGKFGNMGHLFKKRGVNWNWNQKKNDDDTANVADKVQSIIRNLAG